jgi:hypothetical protein
VGTVTLYSSPDAYSWRAVLGSRAPNRTAKSWEQKPTAGRGLGSLVAGTLEHTLGTAAVEGWGWGRGRGLGEVRVGVNQGSTV